MAKHELRIDDLPAGVTEPTEAELDLISGGQQPEGTMKKSWGSEGGHGSIEWWID